MKKFDIAVVVILAGTLLGSSTAFAQGPGDPWKPGSGPDTRTSALDKKCLPDQCEETCRATCGFIMGKECRRNSEVAQECLKGVSSLNATKWLEAMANCLAERKDIPDNDRCVSSTTLLDLRDFVTAEGGEECGEVLTKYRECLEVKAGKERSVQICQEEFRKDFEKLQCSLVTATGSRRIFSEETSETISCFMECR